MTIGPVLALRDAAANKMSALYSRGLPRDFLDVDALIASRRFSPAELLMLADDVEASPMDRTLLKGRFRLIERFPDSGFTAYGASHQQIRVMRARFAGWAEQLTAAAATPTVPLPPSDRNLSSEPLPDDGPDL